MNVTHWMARLIFDEAERVAQKISWEAVEPHLAGDQVEPEFKAVPLRVTLGGGTLDLRVRQDGTIRAGDGCRHVDLAGYPDNVLYRILKQLRADFP